jgi:hypothetical protein
VGSFELESEFGDCAEVGSAGTAQRVGVVEAV